MCFCLALARPDDLSINYRRCLPDLCFPRRWWLLGILLSVIYFPSGTFWTILPMTVARYDTERKYHLDTYACASLRHVLHCNHPAQ